VEWRSRVRTRRWPAAVAAVPLVAVAAFGLWAWTGQDPPAAEAALPLVTADGVHKVRPEGYVAEPPREAAVFHLWSGEPEEEAEVLLPLPESPVPRPR
jgi:hypothetical protein